jgi:membrane peptidoglycan carboxypeptidase
MIKPKTYHGIDQEPRGGMTPTANIVRDAWVFGIIPETETCAGWTLQGIESLYDKVSNAWGPYGHLASRLPPELRERHARIYGAAVENARRQGWDPELDEND